MKNTISTILITILGFTLLISSCNDNDLKPSFDGVYTGLVNESSGLQSELRIIIEGERVDYNNVPQKYKITGMVSVTGNISITDRGIVLSGKVDKTGKITGSYQTFNKVEGVFSAIKE